MIITVTNRKGGVGKTTSCINIAHGLVMHKKKVLLVDLDSQASASVSLGIHGEDVDHSSADVLMDNYPIKSAIKKTYINGLDILPASYALANYDVTMANVKGRETRLRDVLKEVKSAYDFVLIDVPPSVGLLPINALVAADKYIIPTTPEYLALEGLASFEEVVDGVKSGLGAKCDLLGVLLTRVDRRTAASKEIIAMIRDQFKGAVFNSIIFSNVKLLEAPSFGKSIFDYDKKSTGAECYKALCKELITRVTKEVRHEGNKEENRSKPLVKVKK